MLGLMMAGYTAEAAREAVAAGARTADSRRASERAERPRARSAAAKARMSVTSRAARVAGSAGPP